MIAKLYTLQEVSEILSVDRTTLYRWMNAGDLPYVQLNGSRRIKEDDLDAFIEGHRCTGASEQAGAMLAKHGVF